MRCIACDAQKSQAEMREDPDFCRRCLESIQENTNENRKNNLK